MYESAPNVTNSLKAVISEVQNTQTYEFQTIVTQERITGSTYNLAEMLRKPRSRALHGSGFSKFCSNLNYGAKSPDWSAHCCHGNRINNPLPGALRIVILYLPPKFGDSSIFGLVVTIV